MLAHHSTRKTDRYGELYLTNFQHRVLAAMNAMRLEGEHFVDLSEVKRQIVNALEARGYIAPRSAARREQHYRMTALGLEAYHVFQPPRIYRMDGLCPRCGEHPVLRYNGRSAGYCRDCLNAIKRDSRLHGNSKSADAPCACCGATPRYISGGKATSYCAECFKAKTRENRQRRQARLLARIETGDVPTCSEPGCDQPVRHTARHVSNYCIEHERECNRRSWRNRQIRREQALADALTELRQKKGSAFEQMTGQRQQVGD